MVDISVKDILDPIICFFLGGVLIALYREVLKKNRRVLNNGVEVEGVVADFADSMHSAATKYPIVRFFTKDNQQIIETYDLASGFGFKRGQTIPLVYNAQNPSEFVIKSPRYLAFVPWLILVGVAIVTLIGVGMIVNIFQPGFFAMA
ncbi:uncharacterized protein DUF3592 [Chitinophaga skermanii]|uniref:Uncharacterized protein DUF3592 n=1 Tax=Chitinophaga skermanii TaxID=331697 RepID=A0A327QV05_9BACT|nr:DUF3592 domain-containing protein [Chitinophaga skermanii]RAJ08516.1 uncharacterized protein DUF3592 [Chitinophaga skermanii]